MVTESPTLTSKLLLTTEVKALTPFTVSAVIWKLEIAESAETRDEKHAVPSVVALDNVAIDKNTKVRKRYIDLLVTDIIIY